MYIRAKCILISLCLCLLFFRVSGQEEILCKLEVADSLFDDANYRGAIDAYEFLLEDETREICLVNIYYKLGKSYTYVSTFQTAILNFQWALKLLEGEEDQSLEADIYSGMAYAESKLGNFQDAYDLEMIALKIAETEGKDRKISRSVYQLAGYAQSLGAYSTALENYLRVKSLVTDTTKKHYATLIGAIGSLYIKTGELDKAMDYLERSATMGAKIDQPTIVAYALGNLGEAHAKAGNFEIAADYIGSAIERKEELEDLNGVVDSKLQLGYLWMDQQRFGRAEATFMEVIQLAEEIGARKKLLECYFALKQLFSDNGQFEKAFFYLDQYTNLKEEILDETTLKLIEEHNLMYKNAQKDAEIRRLKDIQAERDENYRLKLFIAVACVILLITVVLVGLRINRSLTRKNFALAEFGKQLKQKNIELEHFAHIASHDLKEPLRTISSFTSLLAKKYVAHMDENAQVYMGFIHKSVDNMRNLLDDLLSYARADNTRMEPVRIESKNILHTALANLNAQIEKKEADIEVNEYELPEMKIVPSQMVQLFQNLIANALKFSNGKRPVVHIDCTTDAIGNYRFSIADNGIGIAPQDQQSIFEMFSRLNHEEAFKGAGIGLATCKKIVDHYGGRIWVESELGKGATFYFTLPEAQYEKSRTV